MTQKAHHKNLLDACLAFCHMLLVKLLFSIITEVLLLRTPSLGFLLIFLSWIKMCACYYFFFLFAFSTFSFHDLKKKKKKKKGRHSCAGLKAQPVCNMIWGLDHELLNPRCRKPSKWFQPFFPSGNWFISLKHLKMMNLQYISCSHWVSNDKRVVMYIRRENS